MGNDKKVGNQKRTRNSVFVSSSEDEQEQTVQSGPTIKQSTKRQRKAANAKLTNKTIEMSSRQRSATRRASEGRFSSHGNYNVISFTCATFTFWCRQSLVSIHVDI